jgi:hypothetical protein
MSWSSSFHVKRAVLACVPVLIAGFPLLSWAQGATPPPKPATAPATITLPTPAAVKDSAVKVAAPAASAARLPALSDSARTAIKSQIELELKALGDTLKLTPDQKAKARPILLDHAYQVKQLREKYAKQEKTPAVVESMQKEMQGMRESTDGKLAMVLTGEQMVHYKKWRDEGLTRMRSKMGIQGMTPPAPPAPAAVAPATPAAPAPADTAKKK